MSNFQKFYSGDPKDLMYLVAFDPGQTTGWCTLGVYPGVLSHDEEQKSVMPLHQRIPHIEYGQINCGPSLHEECSGVSEMLSVINRYPSIPRILLEDFIIDFKKIDQSRHTLSPVRITAAFIYGLSEMGGDVDDVVLQNRALAKTTCTDIRLRKWEMFDSHSGPHARDATRHAFYFLRSLQNSSLKKTTKPKEKKERPIGERVMLPWTGRGVG